MQEEKIKSFLESIGADASLFSEESETDIEQAAKELADSWKRAGQADESHLKEIQAKAYGKVHGSYKNMVKKLTGKTDQDVKELDKEGLEMLLSDHLKSLTEGNPDKEAVQEMQAKLAALSEEKENLFSKLTEKEQALKDLEPTLTEKLTNKFKTERALSKAFQSVENFPLETDEAMLAFMPKLGKHTIEMKEGVLRAVNPDTGELLYKDNKAVDVAEMAKAWALSKAPKQKESDPTKKPLSSDDKPGNKYISKRAKALIDARLNR